MKKGHDCGPTFVDVFCGCGGLSLGFLQAGYRCILAIDKDPKAVECYNRNLAGFGARAVVKDVTDFTTRDDVVSFLEEQGISPSSCDVVIGGPPCQSYSVVGRNKIRALVESNGDLERLWERKSRERTNLFKAYALLLEVLAPRWFLFENVPTILSHQTFPRIIKRFEDLSNDGCGRLEYNLVYSNYPASNYGVPQDRRRFILVGYRKDAGIDGWKTPEKRAPVFVGDALDDLPRVRHGQKKRKARYSSPATTPYQRLMRSGKSDAFRGWVLDHICREHNADDVALFKRMKPGARFADVEVQAALREINPDHKLIKYSKDKFKDKLHKLDPKRPAWTVTAHLQKDCYKFIHHRQARTITVREAARLQSFPDWFGFEGLSMICAFRLIGEAVPPVFMRAFAESFANADPGLLTSERTPKKRGIRGG